MSSERRCQLDHERYMAHREERLQKQREYYQAHKEQCKAAVKVATQKRIEHYKELIKNMGVSKRSCNDCLYRDNCSKKDKTDNGHYCPDWDWRYY